MHKSWLGAVTIENGCELGVARLFFLFGMVSPALLRICPTVLAAGQSTFGFMSIPGRCFTKQTKDLRYSDDEPLWFVAFGLTHDDAVCPGKRVVSWINVCNFYRATRRKKCPFQSSVASSECHGQPAIDGSIATKRVGPKGC